GDEADGVPARGRRRPIRRAAPEDHVREGDGRRVLLIPGEGGDAGDATGVLISAKAAPPTPRATDATNFRGRGISGSPAATASASATGGVRRVRIRTDHLTLRVEDLDADVLRRCLEQILNHR